MKRKQNRFTIEFSIPAYWTPEQALAVFEVVHDLSEEIWNHYGSKIIDLLPENYNSRIITRRKISPDDIPF